MTKRLGLTGLWLVIGIALYVTAYLLINTTFMFYDDEGYVQSTLRAFLGGQRLYDEVFTQYGPWPYVYHQLITTLVQLPLTEMFGRALTGIHWVGCALLCGAIVHRITGRQVAAVAATVAAFGLLWQMCSEPSHPGSHLALLMAVAGFVVVRLPTSARPAGLGFALGTIAALAFLTKINVGLLLLTGLGAIALRFSAWPASLRRPAAVAASVGVLILAWALMAQKLGSTWPLIFALQFTLAAAGLLWVTPPAWFDRPLPLRTWVGVAAGFIFTVGLVCGVVILQGTTWSALFEAVVVSPIKQPARFMFGFTWQWQVWPATVAGGLITAKAGWELRKHGELARSTRVLVAGARLLALVCFIVKAQSWLTIYGVTAFITFCLPLAPLFVISLEPKNARDPRRWAAVWLLGFLALPQVLHAFPVAGSQMGWGTFLLVPLFAVGLDEAISIATHASFSHRRLMAVFWSFLLTVNLWQWWLLGHEGWERYVTSRPLDLPGAEDIRMPGTHRATLRLLTLNATVHSDMLFSRPGMFSLNLWSGARTPTTRNATHWFWLLNATEQRDIAASLEKTPRRAIITNRALDQFMSQIHISMDGPLQSYLLAGGYRTLFEHRDFSFLVPVGSKAVPFGLVDYLQSITTNANGQKDVIFRTNLAIDGQPDAVTFELLDPPFSKIQEFSPKHSKVFLERITSSGNAMGPAIPLATAGPLHGLYRLTVFHDAVLQFTQLSDTALIVRDPNGQIIAEAIFKS